MDERNASQNFIGQYDNFYDSLIHFYRTINIGQLLNLLDNVNKNYVRKLEKLNKSFVKNEYGISFNKICIKEGL